MKKFHITIILLFSLIVGLLIRITFQDNHIKELEATNIALIKDNEHYQELLLDRNNEIYRLKMWGQDGWELFYSSIDMWPYDGYYRDGEEPLPPTE